MSLTKKGRTGYDKVIRDRAIRQHKMTHQVERQDSNTQGIKTMLKITINGQVHEVDVPPDMPILWVVRDVLHMKGTKFGCGLGQCGSCTVLLDNKAIRSCVTPVSWAVGKNITTIEGLSREGDHPLQQAWKDLNVPQCGYCQPGQIMNAAGLLHANATPSAKEVREGMAGNICRCGTYQRIEKAILQAADKMNKGGK
tara:strand:+ start:3557 stop:4147 length:591 start_codon:yes stop_codon:yes gene_type:complete